MATMASASIISFETAGAKACKATLFKRCDLSTERAFKNTALMNRTLALLKPGDTLLVPNSTFLLMGGVYGANLEDVTLQLDGTLLFSDDCDAWPTHAGSKMPINAMTFEQTRNFVITSSGTGTFDGNGAAWWGIPGVGYLKRGKNRPPMLSINYATDFLLEHILFHQAPRFNFGSTGLRNATIRYCEVSARRTSADNHGAIDLTAFNTDGFDVSGTDIHIYESSVWNQDDTFCIKANGEDTSNVLVENVQASGVGLSIGSIGKNTVKNITFRNVNMHHSSKGIYIKFRKSAANEGLIENVTYENIYIQKPESWPIWIGPQQAGIKEANQTYNPCHGDPCSLCWPGCLKTGTCTTLGASCPPVNGTIRNLVLRNITINQPKLSPGIMIGDASNPVHVTFDSVRFIDPPKDGAFKTDFFYVKGVNGVATGNTWPIPPGFANHTGR